jgi:hypothetical protein
MESFGTGIAYRSPVEPLGCPHCGQRETVERVASLVAGGVMPIASTIGRMPIVLGTARTYGMTPRNSGGVGFGDVAKYLLPPQEPQGLRYRIGRRAIADGVPGIIGVLLFAVGAIPSITRNTIGDSLPTLPFTLIGAALLVGVLLHAGWGIAQLITGRAQRRIRADVAAYKRATERWNHLYVCTECHCVFTPDRDACIPHRQLRAYLYA